jgi:FMN phosphatase YigB (HAD superfamily)
MDPEPEPFPLWALPSSTSPAARMNSTTKAVAANKNLLLCFDAFGTLFTPNVPIPTAYARAAARHGIDCGDPENPAEVGMRFKEAFKAESRRNPNYGRATGLGAEKWWGNVSLAHASPLPCILRNIYRLTLNSLYCGATMKWTRGLQSIDSSPFSCTNAL